MRRKTTAWALKGLQRLMVTVVAASSATSARRSEQPMGTIPIRTLHQRYATGRRPGAPFCLRCARPLILCLCVQAKALINVKLGEFVRLLLQAWNVSSRLESLCDADESISQGYLAMHVRSRTKKAFERLYKPNAVDVLEGMVELWHEHHQADAQVGHAHTPAA